MMDAANTASRDGAAFDLSALADGEVDGQVALALTQAWRDDAALRSRWHTYQLIGDVLRSDELAGRGRDAAFLQTLRLRLEQEAVVLAPSAGAVAVEAKRHSRAMLGVRRWRGPVAMAAGFVAVVGSLSVMQSPRDESEALVGSAAPMVAGLVPSVQSNPATVAVAQTTDLAERAVPADGASIRDARLDQYLAAHHQFGGSSALGIPSGFLRSATYDGPPAAAALAR